MRTAPTLVLGLIGAALVAGCAGRPADAAATVDATTISHADFAARLATVASHRRPPPYRAGRWS